jgi:molybdopterin-guanine dinucleotide biosynthesis protein A
LIGAILAGGENRRIPFLKGFLDIEGKAIIERTLETLSKVFEKVVISTNMPERYFYLGFPLVGDIMKEKGPMTGILSVLSSVEEESVFVVACDMPFISEKLIRYMAEAYKSEVSRAGGRSGVDVVIPVFEGKKEPLFGIYARRTMHTMEAMILAGEKSLITMSSEMSVRYVAEEEVKTVDPRGRSFANINTIEDYERIGGEKCLV